MGGVAIQDWRVTVHDLPGVVQHDDLGGEVSNAVGGVPLRIGSNVSTTDILDGDVLDVESDVIAGEGLAQRLVVHLDGLDLHRIIIIIAFQSRKLISHLITTKNYKIC